MAASAPYAAPSWNETQQYGSSDDTKALEMGMSGMSFVNNLPGTGSRPPAMAGSSISSAPDDHHRHHSFGSISFPNSDSQNQHIGSTPQSPSSQIVFGNTSQQFLPKPPGLSDPAFGSFGRRGFDQHWGTPDVDSFDRSNDDPDDGLRGLGAIRERAQSSPGSIYPVSSSPPVRIDVNPYQTGDLSPLYTDGERIRALPPDPRRTRSYPSNKSANARPPLSGQPTQQAFLDNSFSSAGNYGGRSSPGSNDVSYEYSPQGGGRSDMADRLQRQRSLTAGSEPHFHDLNPLNRGAHSEQFHQQNIDHTQKFSNLPSLSNVQRLPPHQIQQSNRHIRSYSHSGALQHHSIHEMSEERRVVDQHGRVHHQRLHSDGADIFSGGDSLYARPMQGHGNLPRSMSTGDHHSVHSAPTAGILPRSVSMGQAQQHQGFESQPLQRRNSEYHHEAQYSAVQAARQQIHPSLQRRDEFIGSDGAGLSRASQEEMRSFGGHGYDDRGRNPSQHYPSQSQVPARRHSDYVGMSSSPQSAGNMRTGARYVAQSHQDLRSMSQPGFDDDLTHPLAGEDIDDPGDDLGLAFGNPPSMIPSMRHAPQGAYSRTDTSSGNAHLGHSQPGMPQHYVSMEAMHLTAGSNLPVPRLIYTIKFKRTQRNFIPGPRVLRDLKIGCYVKVEADRGEDLGIVINKIPAEKFNAAGRATFRTAGLPGDIGGLMAPSMTSISDLKRVVRLATHDEVSLLTVKREEEEELLKSCREKVLQRALPMHVVDAEYQFDRHKLTFFFEAECRIDFRELVRDLFSIYKTRIWMQQLDKNCTGTGSPSVLSSLPDYGGMNQVPVMADSINDPYGIPQSSDAGGAGGVR